MGAYIMSTILVARFQLQEEAEDVARQLLKRGYQQQAMTIFYLNPSGQHALYPLGGDRDKSPGAEETDIGGVKGASVGALVGASLGAVVAPLGGVVSVPLGTLAGAHIGGLVGSLVSTEEDSPPARNIRQSRVAGMRLAVALHSAQQEQEVSNLMQAMQAQDIEQTSGEIIGGQWQDFDPLSEPIYIYS